MKSFTGLVVGALVLAVVGAVSVAVWRIEGHLADVLEQTATLQFEQAQHSLDSASDHLAYAEWVPGLGSSFRDQIRMREAVLQYWQRRYTVLAPRQAAAAAAEVEPPVDLQLVFANAVYRAGQARVKNRDTAIEALDEAVSGYANVLRNTTWHPDAAFNYEFAIRLRDEVAKGRRATPAQTGQPEETELGLRGGPSAASKEQFEIYIPQDTGQGTPAGGDAGKAPPGAREG
jgi:hypothetical protein